MDSRRPIVATRSGAVRGLWRGPSAAFYGIPFAQPPVGELRFAAPSPALPWDGVRDASMPGPTPQRRTIGEPTVPEPSFPGDATLNVNIFTPAPADPAAKLPVMVWIHGGAFFAGSPSSPWYDGASFNRDGVVTVSLSYRLGFDGFGWIADAPTNRGLRDLIAGLEWVRDNIAGFGGDPDMVTVAGQSAGGSAVMVLLGSPAAQGLFARAIAQSSGNPLRDLPSGEEIGRELAGQVGVEPTRDGWSRLDEDAVLDAQLAFMTPPKEPPLASAADFVRSALGIRGNLPFLPLYGDDIFPLAIDQAIKQGAGTDKPLLTGTTAHEFTASVIQSREAWADTDPAQAMTEGGMPFDNACAYIAGHPELRHTADFCGQLITDLGFRIPTVARANARQHDNTWLYDFRWPAPSHGLSVHCLDLPFTFDLLTAAGIEALTGPHPPQHLADDMHAAWVRFIQTGNPGWPAWNGHNAQVFAAEQSDFYAVDTELFRPKQASPISNRQL